MKVTQSRLTLCDAMDYRVHGILQARILEWVAFSFSRGSSQPRDGTQVSHIAGGFFTSWATREAISLEAWTIPSNPFYKWGSERLSHLSTDLLFIIAKLGLELMQSDSRACILYHQSLWSNYISIRVDRARQKSHILSLLCKTLLCT